MLRQQAGEHVIEARTAAIGGCGQGQAACYHRRALLRVSEAFAGVGAGDFRFLVRILHHA